MCIRDRDNMPIGSIIFWGGSISKIPQGWAECDGSAVSSAVTEAIGLTNLPDLQNYMPAGGGGRCGTTVGATVESKIKEHTHVVRRLEPGDTKGDPDDAGGSSSSRYRYWRGNNSSMGSAGPNVDKLSSATGDAITAPPVYIGVYIMKVG